ncbi:HAMP domain-containing sensor histidine kinase [Fulvivirgaceae bacterium BMA10]|uniref:histidine kinase n=1 Tax=Splendidivirga corallicola TaxID=3051826 RepID=A0ABT8KIL4_9BACT|nr:HAMP domain-containing sensor histidine kinase [Fulvivirgaceae bacterium BMA10]
MREEENIGIYQSQAKLRWIVLAIAGIISSVSIFYTNRIVEVFKKREQNSVELFANTLEYVINADVDDDIPVVFEEIIAANNSIPLVLTDSDKKPVQSKNVKINENAEEREIQLLLERELQTMEREYEPILVTFRNSETGEVTGYQYVYYRNSDLLRQLQYYPYVQLSVIFAFGLIVFIIFSYSKTAEQNRVWVGLAKETAHQLGTPLSSLMAWSEYFKTDPDTKDKEVILELDKDIRRLEMITSRFSNIGSVPIIEEENIYDVIKSTVNYLQSRISSKVTINVTAVTEETYAGINRPLFEWVIENICKNAVDAMSGVGTIDIHIIKANEGRVIIDIKDSGKGIAKGNIKRLFHPGFTTKKRGWGLGLTLVKRIIENYHKGKIYVKSSEVGVGTTFRIMLEP